MNVNFDTEKNRLHEIFHTFGFEHPKMKGGSSGIMCYPPRSPNAKDAQLFGSDLLNDVLPFIKKEKWKNVYHILFLRLYPIINKTNKAIIARIITPDVFWITLDILFGDTSS